MDCDDSAVRFVYTYLQNLPAIMDANCFRVLQICTLPVNTLRQMYLGTNILYHLEHAILESSPTTLLCYITVNLFLVFVLVYRCFYF